MEEVRKAYQLAIDDGYTHAAVSRSTSIGVSSLKHFYSEDSNLGPEFLKALEDWLAIRGFFRSVWANVDPFQLVAIELRSLYETLRSGIDDDIKRSRLIGFFDDWATVVAGFENAQKGGSQDGGIEHV